MIHRKTRLEYIILFDHSFRKTFAIRETTSLSWSINFFAMALLEIRNGISFNRISHSHFRVELQKGEIELGQILARISTSSRNDSARITRAWSSEKR